MTKHIAEQFNLPVEIPSSLPKPYYDDGKGIVIYHGDSREIGPMLYPTGSPRADLLLTDPPYGIGEAAGRNKSRSKLAEARDFGNKSWDDSPPTKEEIETAISWATNAIIFGGNYFHLPPSKCWLVWDKDNGANDFADCELAWTNLNKAVRKFKWRWAGMLQQNMKEKEPRFHPTQKPTPLIFWCLGHAPDARRVIDPYMGAGTTLLACKMAGIECIGIEREEEHCESAGIRLLQEYLL